MARRPGLNNFASRFGADPDLFDATPVGQLKRATKMFDKMKDAGLSDAQARQGGIIEPTATGVPRHARFSRAGAGPGSPANLFLVCWGR